MPDYHLAYVFERFPTFTQTFCVREVMELQRQGVRPLLFSIRDTGDEPLEEHFPKELIDSVHVLPARERLVEMVNEWKEQNLLPQEAVLTLRHWGDVPDKSRVYEAIYVGRMLEEKGIQHAHTHFAGVGARCCFWLKRFFGIQFSFTGHANDLFEEENFEVRLADLMREAALVITVSDYTANWIKEHFPSCERKLKRVFNGLDLTPFETAAKDARKAEPQRIISVGRLIEKKGFDDLVKACGWLREHSSEPFICQIIGDGPLEDELRTLIESLQLKEHVQLLGAQTQPQIIEALAGASIFALPCVTEKAGGKDNLPTVIMEAMAAALPCVSTRLAGVPEMVTEQETGLLCEEREWQDFAKLMAELLTDPERGVRMGQAGQQQARQLFAKQVTAAELRKHLVNYGSLTHDPALGGYAGYMKRRMLRGLSQLFEKSAQSRFVIAEEAAKRARKG